MVKPGMDSAQVVKLVGQPTTKQSLDLMGSTVSLWMYAKDTAMVNFMNGKVGRVMVKQDLKNL